MDFIIPGNRSLDLKEYGYYKVDSNLLPILMDLAFEALLSERLDQKGDDHQGLLGDYFA